MKYANTPNSRSHGFSLIEVVLAIGIFLVTILALVGLLGPTLKSVDQVEQTDEVASIVNTLNSFLQKSPDIAKTGASKFETIYSAVAESGYATVFIFRSYLEGDSDSTRTELKVGFWGGDVGVDAILQNTDFVSASGDVLPAGSIYRVVLTPSSVIPEALREDTGSELPRYRLISGVDVYPEGYFAMEVRIFAEEPGPSYDPDVPPPSTDGRSALVKLAETDPLFTYNTAIVR